MKVTAWVVFGAICGSLSATILCALSRQEALAERPVSFPSVVMERLDLLPEADGIYTFEHGRRRVYVVICPGTMRGSRTASIAVAPEGR